MQVVHVQAQGASSEHDAEFIRMVVGLVDGVRDIAAVPSLGLISVLYDDTRADPADIVEAVCSAGFGARQCRPRDVAVAAALTVTVASELPAGAAA